MVPYGITESFAGDRDASTRNGPLRVLFVGAVGLRKGVQYLMQAAKLLRGQNVRFRIVGPLRMADRAAGELRRWAEVVGPVPRSAIARQYEWADVFVFPSLCEGSANVCYEALASGLPVITTPNAGSVVRDGVEGYIVPIRCPELLAERIMMLVSNRDLLGELSQNAVHRAHEYSWEHYSQRLLSVVATSVSPKKNGVPGPSEAVVPSHRQL